MFKTETACSISVWQLPQRMCNRCRKQLVPVRAPPKALLFSQHYQWRSAQLLGAVVGTTPTGPWPCRRDEDSNLSCGDVTLLKLWILPLFVHVTKVVFPSDNVIDSLTSVYKTALNLDSWGVTLDILAHSPEEGGYNLATLKVFLYWQHSSLFITHLSTPHQYTRQLAVLSNNSLRAWHAGRTHTASPFPNGKQCSVEDYALPRVECQGFLPR